MKLVLVASTLLFVTFLSSCVSQKKFDELLAERVGLEADNAELLDQLTAANGRISEFEKEVKSLNTETKDQGEKIVKLEGELLELQEEHSKLET